MGDKSKLDDSVNLWMLQSDEKSIREIRKFFGLPELSEKLVNCKTCERRFLSQFAGTRQVTFICRRCKEH